MKFTCSCKTIRQEIDIANKFSSQKNSLSISSNVYLETVSDRLFIKATDGKMAFSSSIPVNTITSGVTTVYCNLLLDVLKRIEDYELEFNEENDKLTINPVDTSETFNINLKTMDASKYPQPEFCSDSLFFSLPQKDFNDMSEKTSFAVADETTTRFFLTGVHIEKKDDKSLIMVATDGRRLSFIERTIEQEIPNFTSVILPVKFLSLVQYLSSNEGLMSIAFANDHVYAKIGNRTISSSLIAGSYPNYERVIPKDLEHTCKLKVSDLIEAVNLISLFTETKSKKIFMDISEDGVMLSGENNDKGDSKSLIKCEYSGPSVKMSFNSTLLLPTIKNFESEYLSIKFSKPSGAMIFMPDPEKDYFFVLMPMQG